MPNQNLTKQTNLVEINISTLDQIYDSLHEEGQTIVHCRYVSKTKYINGGWVNIHPTTFLVRNEETLPLLHAENIPNGDRFKSNEAYYTFVALDRNGSPLKVPALNPETPEEIKRFDGALRRRQLRLVLAGKMKPDEATELKALFITE